MDSKGFYLEPKRVLQRVLLWRQPKNTFKVLVIATFFLLFLSVSKECMITRFSAAEVTAGGHILANVTRVQTDI